jgi:hypothetical protein
MELDLKGYKGFCLTHMDSSREAMKLIQIANIKDIEIKKVNTNVPSPKDYIPIGSIEWTLLSFGKILEPVNYPDFLKDHLHRKVWRSDKWILDQKLFVKPADRAKRFNGFVTNGGYKGKKKPPYWYSEVVHFVDEWRYYVTKGKVVAGEWYWGSPEEPPAPELKIEIPETYSGSIDMGYLLTGEFALVEADLPYATGWYGEKDHERYFQWIIDGWIYLNENFS